MIVNNEILQLETKSTNLTPIKIADSTLSKMDTNVQNPVHTVEISQSGQGLSELYERSLFQAKENPSPIFLTVEKRLELLEQSTAQVASTLGHSFSPEQIKAVADNIGKEVGIAEIPMGDVNAGAGNVYSFLSHRDKAEISDAYQYALDNGTDLKDVKTAAFMLAVTRFREEKMANGTVYHKFDKAESDRLYALANDIEQDEMADVDAKPYGFHSLIERGLESSEPFSSNPFLAIVLQKESVFEMLSMRDPEYFNDNLRSIYFAKTKEA